MEDLIIEEEEVIQFDYGDFCIEYNLNHKNWVAISYDEEVSDVYILHDPEEGIEFEDTEVFGVMISKEDFDNMIITAEEESVN